MNEPGKIMHENDSYMVLIGRFPPMEYHGGGQYDEGYIVVNKDTGVQEVKTPQLPDALMAAEQLDIALTQKQWEWMRATAEAQNEGGLDVPGLTLVEEEDPDA